MNDYLFILHGTCSHEDKTNRLTLRSGRLPFEDLQLAVSTDKGSFVDPAFHGKVVEVAFEANTF